MMKSRKVTILIVIILSISLFSIACAEKVEEKIGKKIGEKVIEKATDEDVNIDTKDGFSIETESGSVSAGENLPWPKDQVGSLPKPEASVISIIKVDEEEDSRAITVVFDKKDGGFDYIEEVIDSGYQQTMISKNQAIINYGGVKDDNTSVSIGYIPEENQGTIIFARNSKEAKRFFEEDNLKEEEVFEIDHEKSMDWPKDSMDNIPAINGEITRISEDKNRISVEAEKVSEEYMISYVEEIKALGFDLEVSESRWNNYISYEAKNEKGYYISIAMTNNTAFINYTKE